MRRQLGKRSTWSAGFGLSRHRRTGNAKGTLDDVGSRLSPSEIRAGSADAEAMTVKTAPRKPDATPSEADLQAED